jgi:ketosteroid isomerase-like protein
MARTQLKSQDILSTAAKSPARGAALILIAALLVAGAGAAFAQKPKKDQSKPPAPGSVITLPDEQAVEVATGEMLGAWQIGDSEKMHQYYAEDALVVSGGWETPIPGWAAYLRAYQVQRAHMQSVRLERTNTFRKVTGNSAWATYQWEFSAIVDNNATVARGHTTLVFEKRNGRWLIVLNHTSIVKEASAPVPGR